MLVTNDRTRQRISCRAPNHENGRIQQIVFRENANQRIRKILLRFTWGESGIMGKTNKDKQTDYWDMLFQLSNVTKYSDSYLLSLKPKEVEKLYRYYQDQN